MRWCDTPADCLWGEQQCLPDGSWGACLETAQRPAGCESCYCDPWCCVWADQCCQDPWQNQDIGDCTQQLECSSGGDPPPLP